MHCYPCHTAELECFVFVYALLSMSYCRVGMLCICVCTVIHVILQSWKALYLCMQCYPCHTAELECFVFCMHCYPCHTAELECFVFVYALLSMSYMLLGI
ncbi:hypothetical protein CHS0354_012134 [Potamilus streckersoni]|uniref:Uncharacterized protein n=1 Tax=Potamilus streckersoni TaxID=2493646 RepID=A0AAE0SA12_9BIVA|nr:hypothetical protein CHS0354_012134 [Potamilus streckersoni]